MFGPQELPGLQSSSLPRIPQLDCTSLGEGRPHQTMMQVQSNGEAYNVPAAIFATPLQGTNFDLSLGDGETEAQSREGTCSGHRSGGSFFLYVCLVPSIVPGISLRCPWDGPSVG